MTDLDNLDPTGNIRQVADDAGAYDPDGTRREMLKRVGLGGAGLAAGGTLLEGILSPVAAFAASSTGQYSTTHKSAANDVKIANFALTLEYLEAAFYQQASQGGALTDPDIAQFAQTLAKHEADHVKELKSVLGSKAVSSPTVQFGPAVTDQTTFLKTAGQLEPVGTGAYGGAGPYIHTPAIAKAALTILAVEARHAAWAATLLNLKGIDRSISPAPSSNNPRYSYKQVLQKVSATKFVTGNLKP